MIKLELYEQILFIILAFFVLIGILFGCLFACLIGATGWIFWLVVGCFCLLVWGVGGLYLYY